jgi:outer membrane protein assembly factor BamB
MPPAIVLIACTFLVVSLTPAAAAAKAGPDPGETLWATRSRSGDGATALGVSPDGSMVFATGSGDLNYETVAYQAATGRQVWASRYRGPSNADGATALGVSPDGSIVFVTGQSGVHPDYATVAYDAHTGAQLWASRYNGTANYYDIPTALRVSPDGSRVFVTGSSNGSNNGSLDYATLAYDAASGEQLWVSVYDETELEDSATGLGVSPDGSTVFVTGRSYGSYWDYATVAYDAATGSELWVSRYDATGNDDTGTALGVSPDGSTVFVTGTSIVNFNFGFATVAYDAATGLQLWASRYEGPGEDDHATSLAVDPGGSMVFVTGQSFSAGYPDYATVAYDADTGVQQWLTRYDGPGNGYYDTPTVLGVGPDGSKVFVTGQSTGSDASLDYATVSYDAISGAQLWASRIGRLGSDVPNALGVSPDGSALFITGSMHRALRQTALATIAYAS